MRMIKKITAAVLAAALTGTIAVTASAVDVVGSVYNTKLTIGEKETVTIAYDESGVSTGWSSSFTYDSGTNYHDFTISVAESGTLVLVFDAEINQSNINVYHADTKESVNIDKLNTYVGSIYGLTIATGKVWSEAAGMYSGAAQYKVQKGDYIIRFYRANYYGTQGSGVVHITPYMKKLGDVNNDGRINAADAAAVLKHVAELEKLSSIGAINADTNNDGKLNAADAAAILRDAAGIAKLS